MRRVLGNPLQYFWCTVLHHPDPDDVINAGIKYDLQNGANSVIPVLMWYNRVALSADTRPLRARDNLVINMFKENSTETLPFSIEN